MTAQQIGPPPGERGSALMIVLIMAGVIAIMLYRELPVAAFEAQRAKEQQLIDRGHEYTQAVRLYVRRVGSYPPSLEALEDTNRIRFLRHRFKDPFTGQVDWRLLHAGPGGLLMDSKVKPFATNVNGQDSSQNNSGVGNAPSPGGATASSLISEFSQSSSSGSDSPAGEVTVLPARQRPPAIRANGNGVSSSGSAAASNSPDPTTPLLPASSTESAISGGAQPEATPTGTPQPAGGQFGPGIVGVASIAEGHTIKTVNDQTDYSLWEFYYDPLKDPFRLTFGPMRDPWAAQNAPGSPGTKGAPGSGTAPIQKP